MYRVRYRVSAVQYIVGPRLYIIGYAEAIDVIKREKALR